MAHTKRKKRERRPLGVLLIVELRGRLRGPAGWRRKSWPQQVDEAVEYFTRLTTTGPAGNSKSHGEFKAQGSSGKGEADIPFEIERVFAAFPVAIEMQSISLLAVEDGMQLDDKNGPGEHIIFIENIDAFNVLSGAASPAINESQIRGLDSEVQELVRAREVRSIQAYRVVEVATSSASETSSE